MNELKQDLSSFIAEAEAGEEILVTRHNKPVARLSRAETGRVHFGAEAGKTKLKPALRGKTGGRYLDFLREDRSGRE